MATFAQGILSGLGLLAAASLAAAQETAPPTPVPEASSLTKAGEVKPRREGVRGILISGEVRLSGVYRDEFFDKLFPGEFRAQTPNQAAGTFTGPPAGADEREETFVNAYFGVSVDIDVNDDLRGFFELATGRDSYGGESHRVGDDNQVPTFRQGYLQINASALGFLRENFDAALRIGIQNVVFDNRKMPPGERNPFLVDLQNAENPFTGLPGLPTRANGYVPQLTVTNPTPPPTTIDVPTGPGFSANSFLGGNAWWNNYIGQEKTQEAGGAWFTARLAKDPGSLLNADLDLGAFTVLETGMANSDVNVTFFSLDISFGGKDPEAGLPDHHSLLNIMALGIQGNSTLVGTVGGGLSLFLFKNSFELFGEGYYQSGDYFDPIGPPQTDQRAYAGYFGGRLQYPLGAARPYLEVSYWYVSGDQGNASEDNNDFLSLENVNQALLIEGSETGLDIDTNYAAVKGQAGLTFFHEVDVSLFVGVFRLNHRDLATKIAVDVANGATGDGEISRDLGTEIDLRITWRPNEAVRLSIAGGFLTGADFFDESGRGEKSAFAGLFSAAVMF